MHENSLPSHSLQDLKPISTVVPVDMVHFTSDREQRIENNDGMFSSAKSS